MQPCFNIFGSNNKELIEGKRKMTIERLRKKVSNVRPKHSRTPGFMLRHLGKRDAKRDYVQKDTFGSYSSEWIREKGKHIEAATLRVFAICAQPDQEERAKRISLIETQANLAKQKEQLAPQLKDMKDLTGSEHRQQRKLRERMAAINKQLTNISEEIPKIEGKIREIEFLAENQAAQIKKSAEAQVMIYLRGARRDLEEQATINFYFEDDAEDQFRRYFPDL